MSKGQIIFNNKKSFDDFSLNIEDVNISFPTPQVKSERIPYSNKVFDFSSVSGFTPYDERTIEITFSIFGLNRIYINSFYSNIIMWLYESEKNDLSIDYYRGIFKARVLEVSPVEHLESFNKIIVTFIAEPFAEGDAFGSDIWDNFNFMNDVVEEDSFIITGTTSFNIINTGAKVSPIIHCTEKMNLKFNNITYSLDKGDNQIPIFFLNNGINKLEATGNGIIKFKFNKLYF